MHNIAVIMEESMSGVTSNQQITETPVDDTDIQQQHWHQDDINIQHWADNGIQSITLVPNRWH